MGTTKRSKANHAAPAKEAAPAEDAAPTTSIELRPAAVVRTLEAILGEPPMLAELHRRAEAIVDRAEEILASVAVGVLTTVAGVQKVQAGILAALAAPSAAAAPAHAPTPAS